MGTIQTPLSSSTYSANILSSLQATGVQMTAPGGKARAYSDNVAADMSILEMNAFSNLMNTLLPYATGTTLDFIGSIYNIARIGQVDATVAATDQNFEWYVRYGTFGSINNGNAILIPAGTNIYTAAGTNGPVYVTSYPITLAADQSSIYFDAASAVPGAQGQSAGGTFNGSSFSNYADSKYGTLLVTNNFGITAGTDAESDDNYRFRIALQAQATGGSQETDIRAAILPIAGVQDVVFEGESGTFTAYVYGIDPAVPTSLLQAVQAAINQTVAYPLSGLAVTPDLIGISLATTVNLVPGVLSTAAPAILTAAAAAASDYINNLAIVGGSTSSLTGSSAGSPTLVINQIAARLINADPSILDIGQPDAPINSIFIWRSRADGTRYSRTLVGDYTPALGERIVVENIANAISLTQAT